MCLHRTNTWTSLKFRAKHNKHTDHKWSHLDWLPLLNGLRHVQVWYIRSSPGSECASCVLETLWWALSGQVKMPKEAGGWAESSLSDVWRGAAEDAEREYSAERDRTPGCLRWRSLGPGTGQDRTPRWRSLGPGTGQDRRDRGLQVREKRERLHIHREWTGQIESIQWPYHVSAEEVS